MNIKKKRCETPFRESCCNVFAHGRYRAGKRMDTKLTLKIDHDIARNREA